MDNNGLKPGLLLLVSLFGLLGVTTASMAAPKADLWPRWQAHDASSTRRIDHTAWGEFLDAYLTANHPSGIARVRYSAVSGKDKRALEDYLAALQATPVSTLNRDEQRAYWINLYNALTVQVILDHYPVDSIRDIGSGWFSSGPWKDKLVVVEGERLSLDDIEHRILRPIWRDNRIHYAVNCASIGCPNLPPEPFSAQNGERLLDAGAHAYINHPRGVRLEKKALTLSSIYDWFVADFGGTEQGVIEHLLRYAKPETAQALRQHRGDIDYEYDWDLNE